MLSKNQIDKVQRSLIDSGITYAPLLDELTDHLCEEIEEKMDGGLGFNVALKQVIDQQRASQVKKSNTSIINNVNYSAMIKNYIKLGIRSLARHKLISIINLSGLVLGMTVFLFIGIYIFYHNSFDHFHDKSEKIYRVVTTRTLDNGTTSTTAFSGAPWGPHIVESVPEVVESVRLMKYRLPVGVTVKESGQKFYEKNLIWADNSFFSIFSFELLKGNKNSVLTQPNQVVLTESLAKRYFGNKNPIGETLTYEDDVNLMVTGIVKDFPPNSHIQADLIGSFSTLGNSFWFNIIDNWNVLYYYTYLHLNGSQSVDVSTKNVRTVLAEHVSREIDIQLQPISSIHTNSTFENELTPSVRGSGLVILGLVALIILLVSIVNYINLSNARAFQRAKEVGIIKVMGSGKWLVFLQFMIESFILALLSFFTSIVIVLLSFSEFSNFIKVELTLPPTYLVFLVGLSIVLLVSILSGLYTALHISGISIISALKGNNKGSNLFGFNLRRVLITFQFISGVGLIASTLIISDQVNYLMSSDTGYAKTDAIEIPIHENDYQTLETLKEQLANLSEVEHLALSSHRMSGDQLYRSLYFTDRADSVVMGRLHIDYDFINTFKLDLLVGRSFSKEMRTDTSNFIINETAGNMFGFSSPEEIVGNKLSYFAQNENGRYLKTGKVIGVVRDFNFESLHSSVGPLVMDIQPERNHFLNVRLSKNANDEKVIKRVQKEWETLFPKEPFSFFRVEDRYLDQYQSEAQLEKIITVFGIVSILISMLGLFGLNYFDTAIRSKEIGLRKVLGASTWSILKLFIKDYFVLIGVGFAIITPLISWLMTNWLNNFAYHTGISLENFIIPVILLSAVVAFTTSFIIIKAANTNPIDSLKYE